MSGPVLIAGFHRSGTSAVARAFHAAGLNLGERLLGAEPANPYGHFEDEDAIALHDELLEAEDLTWKSPDALVDRSQALDRVAAYAAQRLRAANGAWGLKDPRLCLFLPEWLAATPDASLIFVIRSPGAAIASLHRRHIQRHVDTGGVDPSDLDFWRDPDLGLKLWCHYHEQALPFLRAHGSATVIEFGSQDTNASITRAIERAGLSADEAVVLDARLGHSDTSWFHDPALLHRATDLWEMINGSIR